MKGSSSKRTALKVDGIGPENVLVAGACVHHSAPKPFTGWGSEGVNIDDIQTAPLNQLEPRTVWKLIDCLYNTAQGRALDKTKLALSLLNEGAFRASDEYSVTLFKQEALRNSERRYTNRLSFLNDRASEISARAALQKTFAADKQVAAELSDCLSVSLTSCLPLHSSLDQ